MHEWNMEEPWSRPVTNLGIHTLQVWSHLSIDVERVCSINFFFFFRGREILVIIEQGHSIPGPGAISGPQSHGTWPAGLSMG